MPGTPARVVLLTDRRSHRAKAAAVQSVIEVTGVDPPTAVKLLSDNAWNTSVNCRYNLENCHPVLLPLEQMGLGSIKKSFQFRYDSGGYCRVRQFT